VALRGELSRLAAGWQDKFSSPQELEKEDRWLH
jgi:hypothetical protein